MRLIINIQINNVHKFLKANKSLPIIAKWVFICLLVYNNILKSMGEIEEK